MLIFFLISIGVIVLELLLYKNVIPIEIFLAAVNIFLAIDILRRYLCSKKRTKKNLQLLQTFPVPERPKTPPCIKNKFIAHWQRRHSNRKMFPLNRIAFFRAKYVLRSETLSTYDEELSIPFLKSLAEKPYVILRKEDECHPRRCVTEFYESYIQHRAVLYFKQGMQNASAKYQCTLPSREVGNSSSNSVLDSRTSFVQVRRYSELPPPIDHELRSMELKREAENMPETNSEMWNDFESIKEQSRKKLEVVKSRFDMMKQQEKMAKELKKIYEDD